MPTTLDPTIGGASANTYISRARFDAIMADRLNASAATGASDDDKDRALLMATAALDRVEWDEGKVGYRVSIDQALRFPAYGVLKRFDDDFYESTEIPDFVELATAEAALAFLQSDRQTEPSRDRSVASESVGPLSRSYFRGEITPKDPLAMPVWDIIAWWAAEMSRTFGGGVTTGDVVRGY